MAKKAIPRGLSVLKSLLAGKGGSTTKSGEIPASKGTYVLVFHVTNSIVVRTKYGERPVDPGTYAYVGSAFGPGGLRARVSRHLRREKKRHWHIDWITTSEAFQPMEVWIFPEKRIESEIATALNEVFESVPGFGASDSREDSHLFRISS